MEKLTISFSPKWGSDGTVYRNNVFLSEVVVTNFLDSLACEVANPSEKRSEGALFWMEKSPIKSNLGTFIEINLSQASYFREWAKKMKENNQIDFDEKRLAFDENMSLNINTR